MTTATVVLWGTPVGYVSMDAGEAYARFEYDPDFLSSGIELAPIEMPGRRGVMTFPGLPSHSFYGLPGLLAEDPPLP